MASGVTDRTSMSPSELARLLTRLAESLERDRVALGAGILRQAACHLATCRCQPEAAACRSCGSALEHPARGRRRLYCSPRCRWRAAKHPQKSSVQRERS